MNNVEFLEKIFEASYKRGVKDTLKDLDKGIRYNQMKLKVVLKLLKDIST